MDKFSSLYVHLPFCETKCHYCDFYSLADRRVPRAVKDRFYTALRAEAERSKGLLAPKIRTIFLGGGTPSMTDPEDLARALEPLDLASRIDGSTEFTMEANPSSVDRERMKAYQEIGINRVSMGVQALHDELLERLGRVHSKDRALTALEEIFSSGIKNASVDLLCGVPGQSLELLEEAMERLTRFPITHLSCYLLTLPPQHRMFKELPDEATQLSHLECIDRFMIDKGFRHYEISNFARPGFEAQHNLVYWNHGSYLSLGPSAHSFDQGKKRRWKNVSSLQRYSDMLLEQDQEPLDWEETLDPSQLDLEAWMLALRLSEGMSIERLESSNQKKVFEKMIEEQLCELHPEDSARFRLTWKGFALSDEIVPRLMG
jgi:oxygen-independent coproporphyrinogen-3 oxidase